MTNRPTGGPTAGRPDADRWRRVRALFEVAIDRDSSEWPRLLAMAADDERELLAQLLAADGSPEPLLDRTPVQLAADLFDYSEPVPDRIDKYRIVRLIGRGGMGQVLLARRDDGSYDQEVAIKVVRRGMDSEDVLRRFRAERQILAGLTHANIATLLDGGITADGRPYFVLEFVPGLSITTYCETHDLPLEARLELFATTCAAVQYAHARGIVHRDLKPRNIIVAEATPPASGTVKLLDFGIARLLDAGAVDLTIARTHTGSRLMTPEYASPEQLRGGLVGPASDVYSLGVVLHELVTGRRPHDLQGVPPSEIERVVCEQPVTLRAGEDRHVPAALGSIILMALRKEPERRYATAGELGDDVRRFVAGDEVHARADSITYRVGAFVRRRRVGLALGVAALAVVVAVAVVGVALTALGGGGSPAPVALAAATAPVSIAVLPFDYAGPEGQEYFADGLAEVVHDQLATVRGLTVVAHSRAVQYRDTESTPQSIGAELGVTYVLAGSVSFERPTEPSGRVVLMPRLIRVADDSTVWGRTFDQTMVRFFALQSAVTRDVAQALRLATDAVPASPRAATADLEAYHFYLRGNDFFRFNEDEARLRLAESSYLEAVARDSTFAEAWAKLSATHTMRWFHHYDRSDERLDRAREAAERALRLHPGLPESYYALGMFLYQGRGDLYQAQGYFERALELQPNHANSLSGLAFVLRRQGRLEEALVYFEQLTVLDPLEGNHLFSVAFTRQLLRQYEAAEPLYAAAMRHGADLPVFYATWARLRLSRTGSIDEARSVLAQGAGASLDNDVIRYVAADLDLMSGRYREVLLQTAVWKTDVLDAQPWYMPVAWLRAAAYRGLGEQDSARVHEQIALRLLEQRLRAQPDDARAHSALGRVYATLGRDDDAIRSAQRGVELMPYNRDAVLAPFRVEDLAAVYVLTGRLDDAITTLESLLSLPGLVSSRQLHADPFWAPLKGHPRFPSRT
jgi:eukaryotic-like serine/threonine-protein kinase